MSFPSLMLSEGCASTVDNQIEIGQANGFRTKVTFICVNAPEAPRSSFNLKDQKVKVRADRKSVFELRGTMQRNVRNVKVTVRRGIKKTGTTR